MKITLCGSIAFFDKMQSLSAELMAQGHLVFMPIKTEGFNYDSYSDSESAQNKIANNLIMQHYEKILNSDCILVVNLVKNKIQNYVGGNTLLEMGFAFVQNKPIFVLNPLPHLSYLSEMEGMQPVIIDGDISKIEQYFEEFYSVYVASENQLKRESVVLGLTELGKKVQVTSVQASSQVADQPTSWEEMYTGVMNRMSELKKVVDNYDYLVSFESGMVKLMEARGYFDVHVCLMENNQGESHMSVVGSLEFPKELVNRIPTQYPDLGVLVQKEFGVQEKDPIVYLSNGALSRRELLLNAVKASFVQFESPFK